MLKIKSGVLLAIVYGYSPCQLGLCGPQDRKRRNLITQYLRNIRKSEEKIRKILKDFKGAYPYYKLIAKSNGIVDPLDYRAVEAYWLGNSLLENVKIADYKKMMKEEFFPLGKMSQSRIKNLPSKAIPLHSLHVLVIGSVTGRFQETKPGLDLCRVSWGRVKQIRKENLVVARQALKFGKKVVLDKMVERVISWNKDILPAIRVGDFVSIHWNTAIEKLTLPRLTRMKKYHQKVLRIIGNK